MRGITDSDAQSSPDGGKDAGGSSPLGLSKSLVVGLYSKVGGDRCEKSSDKWQADSDDGIACQVSVHALANMLEMFSRHSLWVLLVFSPLW
jgi:hypothetical protein